MDAQQARAEVERLREALRGLKGEGEVVVHNFRTVRVVSYYVLNRRINAILNAARQEAP